MVNLSDFDMLLKFIMCEIYLDFRSILVYN